MERSAAGVDVVAAMVRTDVGWKMRIIEEPAEQGQHFMDILPLLSRVISTFLPNAPKRQKVAFAMEKGGVLDMPLGMNSITVGLGWGVDEGEVDLDVSAVLLDQRGGVLEAVFFGHLESAEHGIVHSGDNLTGEGEGDDEQIRVDLLHVGLVAQQVFFVVNIYSQNKTFRQGAGRGRGVLGARGCWRRWHRPIAASWRMPVAVSFADTASLMLGATTA
ncbi:unnamed protein product [Effrenium voratum]|nr:unnamed protein product [Effrenium voratum]